VKKLHSPPPVIFYSDRVCFFRRPRLHNASIQSTCIGFVEVVLCILWIFIVRASSAKWVLHSLLPAKLCSVTTFIMYMELIKLRLLYIVQFNFKTPSKKMKLFWNKWNLPRTIRIEWNLQVSGARMRSVITVPSLPFSRDAIFSLLIRRPRHERVGAGWKSAAPRLRPN
jgi:hypothetical protein